MNVTLTDDAGQRWSLLFDTYQPVGSLLAYNAKRVRVEGLLVAENTIQVDALTVT